MSILRKSLSILLDFAILLIFSLVLLGTLLGAKFSEPSPLTTIGNYQLAAFPTGIALYQHGRTGPYYGFSPLNDYYFTKAGNRSALLTVEDFNSKNYQTNVQNEKNPWEKLLPALQMYWGDLTLQYTISSSVQANYHSTIEDGKIQMNTALNFPTPITLEAIGNTIQYSSKDIVINPTTKEILSDSDQEKIANINQLLNTNFVLYEATLPDSTESAFISTEVPSGQLIVFSPEQPGGIRIFAERNQTLFVNPFFRLIEVVSPVKDEEGMHFTSRLNIEVLDDLKKL